MTSPVQHHPRRIPDTPPTPAAAPLAAIPLHPAASPEEHFLASFGADSLCDITLPLPSLKPAQLQRLVTLLRTSLNFTAFDKSITITLKKLLQLLPEGEIQLVGGALKHVLGSDWLAAAGKVVLGEEHYIALFGDAPHIETKFPETDIDIRIWPKDKTEEPEGHAQELLRKIAELFDGEGHTSESICEELRRNYGPFPIFEPKFIIQESKVTNHTFLASYKTAETELDLYFVKVLEDPITLADEDLFLSIEGFINKKEIELTPIGSKSNGWLAVLSMIGKVILPQKRDIPAWLRAMRREVEGFRFYDDAATNFILAPFSKLELLIPNYLHRRSIHSTHTQVMLILNMAAYNLRLPEHNHDLTKALKKIVIERTINGLRGKIYAAAQEVGWEPIAALLKLTQPLTEAGRWQRGVLSCNFDFSMENALHALAGLQHGGDAVKALLAVLMLHCPEGYPIGLLYQLEKTHRRLLCEAMMEESKHPESTAMSLFLILMKIDIKQAHELVKKYYSSITGSRENVELLLETLSLSLPQRNETMTHLERINIFNVLCRKLSMKADYRSIVEEGMTKTALRLFESNRLEECISLLQQVHGEDVYIKDPLIWMNLLAMLYKVEKTPDTTLALLKIAHERKIWNESCPYVTQIRFFLNVINFLLNLSTEEEWLPVVKHLITHIPKSGITVIHRKELTKLTDRFKSHIHALEIAWMHIREDLEKLSDSKVTSGKALEEIMDHLIDPLIDKLRALEDGHAYLEESIDQFRLFLQRMDSTIEPSAIVNVQTKVFLLAQLLKNKKVSEERCHSFFLDSLNLNPHTFCTIDLLTEAIRSGWITSAHEQLIIWLRQDQHAETAFNTILKLLEEGCETDAQTLLALFYTQFSDEQLSIFIAKTSLEFLLRDPLKSSQLLKKIILKSDPPTDTLKENLAILTNHLRNSPITEKKLLALMELGVLCGRIESSEVLKYMNFIQSSSNAQLNAKIWRWYRDAYHLKWSEVNSSTRIDASMVKMHAVSMKLLISLDKASYAVARTPIEQLLASHDIILMTLRDKHVYPDVINFLGNDLLSMLSAFIRLSDQITEQEILSAFKMMSTYAFKIQDVTDGRKQVKTLMFKLAERVYHEAMPNTPTQDSHFVIFLTGWSVLKCLLQTTENIDTKHSNLACSYLEESYKFSPKFYDKLDDELLSFVAKMILTNTKLSEEQRKKLAIKYLAHTAIAQIQSGKLPMGLRSIHLRIKETVEPLTADERLIIKATYVKENRRIYIYICEKIIYMLLFIPCWILLGWIYDARKKWDLS